jgi:ribosomal protein S18 acetylase RimI-like enzyme
VTVRRLVSGDEADLRFIRARALERAPAAFSSGPGDDRFEVPGFAGALLADPDNAVFGAFRGPIIGMVGLHPSGHRKTAHALDLWGLFVEPEWRRAGIARSLVTEAIGFARSAGSVSYVRVAVTDAAPEAVALYRALGFIECGYEPDALRLDGVSIGETSMRLALDATST